jgi:TATA-box binding protein (TBP) (component of TFIID and TFIIIB)
MDGEDLSSEPAQLRTELEERDIEHQDGTTGGFVQLEDDLNLNALAIGLGLENIEYEPERFPGLVYRQHHEEDVTIILFGNGTMTVVDAQNVETVRTAIRTTIERTNNIGMTDATLPEEDKITIRQLD